MPIFWVWDLNLFLTSKLPLCKVLCLYALVHNIYTIRPYYTSLLDLIESRNLIELSRRFDKRLLRYLTDFYSFGKKSDLNRKNGWNRSENLRTRNSHLLSQSQSCEWRWGVSIIWINQQESPVCILHLRWSRQADVYWDLLIRWVAVSERKPGHDQDLKKRK